MFFPVKHCRLAKTEPPAPQLRLSMDNSAALSEEGPGEVGLALPERGHGSVWPLLTPLCCWECRG